MKRERDRSSRYDVNIFRGEYILSRLLHLVSICSVESMQPQLGAMHMLRQRGGGLAKILIKGSDVTQMWYLLYRDQQKGGAVCQATARQSQEED